MTKSIQLTDHEAHTALERAAQMPVAHAPAAGTFVRYLFASPGRLVQRVVEARRHSLAMQELHALDDRMLKDIGIDRGSIPRVARFGREIV